MQVLIEHRQGDVGQQRRQDSTLRCAGVGVLVLAEFGKNPAMRNALTSTSTRLSLTRSTHPIHQGDVVDGVEARLDVRVSAQR